ncbi:PREDICTED: multiple inositol polyphosphate phosphatase 1-like isoform X1 [Nicrophorus vespilloides]|nr:PREDICTED: multiple inositol polyphosphate phosphatase 1-like isoform X1 [Nicrophorus vespilloides]XP_017777681.1 PREDICTED: multiple inositol polyphosphate phosphatase 1-like isoform X1 [Nicrophorus vespilloides]XP_017777685.1 PREDICTED: multiple inositol polyphosphate phosphatase 1-like isoform X1 [Nicrophorus vespilloides]
MEVQTYLILKWLFLLIAAKSIFGDIYDEDRNRGESYDPYNTNRDQYGRDNYNRNQYDSRNNQTGNYDPYNRNYGRNEQRYNSSDPYNRDPYNANDPYNRNPSDPNNRNQNDPYNRNQNDPYNKNQNNPYNRNQNDPYNRNQNDPYNKNQNDPYNRNPSDPYNRNQNDPYNRNQNTYNRNDNRNDFNRNPNDPYGANDSQNRNPNDPYNKNPNDPYNRNQNDPYNRDGNRGDFNRNNDNRDDRFRNNESNYGTGKFGDDDGKCCEEYCYSTDSDAYVRMGSKTSYQFVYGKTSNQHVVPQCKPVQYWSAFREGTSIPDRMSIERYRNLQRIHDQIMKNYGERGSYPNRGRLCAEDYSLIRSWGWNETVNEHKSGSLSSQGAEDLKFIARRIQSRFRDLLVPYSETQYYFEYTEGDKSYESYQAFIQGLFGNDAQRVHATVRNPASFNSYGDNSNQNQIYSPFSQGSYSPSFSENRESSQYGSTPDSRCKTYEQRSDEDRSTASEYQTFKQKPEYRDMVRDVFRRLGFRHTLNDTIIEDMYDLCRYEKSWFITRPSPWCVAFTHAQHKLLEYGEDLFYYYRSGYGHEHLNKNLGCGLLKDLYERFERIVDGSTNQAKGIVHFRNIDEILKLMVALGIGQDQGILTADNYYQMDRRQWRTSQLAPFSGNIAAVLYQCDNQNDKYKVMFFMNENPVEFPECSVGLCSWEVVRDKYQMLAQNCRLDFCERGAAHSNASAAVVLIFSALFGLLSKHLF